MKSNEMRTDYCSRYFTESEEDGLLAVGYIARNDATNNGGHFSFHNYHCAVVLSGSGCLTDQEGHSYILAPNTLFQLLPDCKYTLSVDPSTPWHEFHICIGKSTYKSLSAIKLLHDDCPSFPVNLKTFLTEWMDILLDQLKGNQLEDLNEVFFNTQKFLAALHKEDSRNIYTNINSTINNAKRLIASNYKEPMSFQETASILNMSYERFRKVFKEHTGISPLQFRLQSKFLFASRLLMEGVSIQEVAAETGYQDPFIFSKQFKKYVGVSPSSYKKKLL